MGQNRWDSIIQRFAGTLETLNNEPIINDVCITIQSVGTQWSPLILITMSNINNHS